ncbi:MAG: lytic transglycosylase domain-containing protein [Planctomycetota bacterium]
MRNCKKAVLTGAALACGVYAAMVLWPEVAVARYREVIERAAARFDVDARLVRAVVRVESSGRRRARSRRGAVGLMQVLPSTAEGLAAELGLREFREEDLEDPDVNVMLGTYYLWKLCGRFGGDLALALAAYNAGPTRVSEWVRENPGIAGEALVERAAYPETRRFVRAVLRRVL